MSFLSPEKNYMGILFKDIQSRKCELGMVEYSLFMINHVIINKHVPLGLRFYLSIHIQWVKA